MGGETGRHVPLAGSIAATAGMGGYVAAMTHAGINASILDAFTSQGLLGWASAALLLGGVAVWSAGNFTALQDLAEMPRQNGR
jgi:hypothetical protein